MNDWTPHATTTHQDHVTAHVVGATPLAYFVFDETAYVLLDIGFIWNIYLDGEMGLVPSSMAIAELNVDDDMRSQLRLEVDSILQGRDEASLTNFTPLTPRSPIQSVDFSMRESLRRLTLTCEDATFVIETSLNEGAVKVMSTEESASSDLVGQELQEAGREGERFVRERLENELGHPPTDEEVNDWLREHTESY